jgi:hypothetical protein
MVNDQSPFKTLTQDVGRMHRGLVCTDSRRRTMRQALRCAVLTRWNAAPGGGVLRFEILECRTRGWCAPIRDLGRVHQGVVCSDSRSWKVRDRYTARPRHLIANSIVRIRFAGRTRDGMRMFWIRIRQHAHVGLIRQIAIGRISIRRGARGVRIVNEPEIRTRETI